LEEGIDLPRWGSVVYPVMIAMYYKVAKVAEVLEV